MKLVADYSNISKGLLDAAKRAEMVGVETNEEVLSSLTQKLLSYDPNISDRNSKIFQLLNVLIEAEENRDILEKEEKGALGRIYDEALVKINSWGGVTGFLSPEGGKVGKNDKERG